MPAPKKKKPVSAASVMEGLMAGAAPQQEVTPPVEIKPPVLPHSTPAERTAEEGEGRDTPSPHLAAKTTQKRPMGRPSPIRDYPQQKRSYYIPADVVEALRVKQFYEPKSSTSAHVELALRRYLGMDIPPELQ